MNTLHGALRKLARPRGRLHRPPGRRARAGRGHQDGAARQRPRHLPLLRIRARDQRRQPGARRHRSVALPGDRRPDLRHLRGRRQKNRRVARQQHADRRHPRRHVRPRPSSADQHPGQYLPGRRCLRAHRRRRRRRWASATTRSSTATRTGCSTATTTSTTPTTSPASTSWHDTTAPGPYAVIEPLVYAVPGGAGFGIPATRHDGKRVLPEPVPALSERQGAADRRSATATATTTSGTTTSATTWRPTATS